MLSYILSCQLVIYHVFYTLKRTEWNASAVKVSTQPAPSKCINPLNIFYLWLITKISHYSSATATCRWQNTVGFISHHFVIQTWPLIQLTVSMKIDWWTLINHTDITELHIKCTDLHVIMSWQLNQDHKSMVACCELLI